MKSYAFDAVIALIGINPYVQIPEAILAEILSEAGKSKGPIPIKGTINGLDYQQTLVKYSGLWRLYINTTMLKNSPKRIGETVAITIQLDFSDRTLAPHPKLTEAFTQHATAKWYLINSVHLCKRKSSGILPI